MIVQLNAFDDNYLYLLRVGDKTAAIDPGDPEVIEAELQRRGWRLDSILITHHHWDHVGGVKKLQQTFGCKVLGPDADRERIPGISQGLRDGDEFDFAGALVKFFHLPGHTRGHGAYLVKLANETALFCGDTLFSVGCGRLFEGSPEQMWQSLMRLRELADDVQVYCAHEYTASNIQFALSVDGANHRLQDYAREVEQLRRDNRPTVPVGLGLQKQVNPFMRADQVEIAAALEMAGAAASDVFAKLRKMKDNF